MNGDWRHKKAEEEEEEAQADKAGQERAREVGQEEEEEARNFHFGRPVGPRRAWGHGHFSKNGKSQGLSLSFCAHGDERGDSISALLIENL